MGRDGTDPNGEYDFWNDATGGGNCWAANSAGSSFAPGNGSVPLGTIYPACPQAPVLADQVRSLNLGAGLQVDPRRRKRPGDDPRLRRPEPAAEPAVLVGAAGRRRTRRSKASPRSRSRPSRAR